MLHMSLLKLITTLIFCKRGYTFNAKLTMGCMIWGCYSQSPKSRQPVSIFSVADWEQSLPQPGIF